MTTKSTTHNPAHNLLWEYIQGPASRNMLLTQSLFWNELIVKKKKEQNRIEKDRYELGKNPSLFPFQKFAVIAYHFLFYFLPHAPQVYENENSILKSFPKSLIPQRHFYKQTVLQSKPITHIGHFVCPVGQLDRSFELLSTSKTGGETTYSPQVYLEFCRSRKILTRSGEQNVPISLPVIFGMWNKSPLVAHIRVLGPHYWTQ